MLLFHTFLKDFLHWSRIKCSCLVQRVLKAYAAKLYGRLPKTATGGTTGMAAAGTTDWQVHLLLPSMLFGFKLLQERVERRKEPNEDIVFLCITLMRLGLKGLGFRVLHSSG